MKKETSKMSSLMANIVAAGVDLIIAKQLWELIQLFRIYPAVELGEVRYPQNCERWAKEGKPPELRGVPFYMTGKFRQEDLPTTQWFTGEGGWKWRTYFDYDSDERGRFWFVKNWGYRSPQDCNDYFGGQIDGVAETVLGKVKGQECVFFS